MKERVENVIKTNFNNNLRNISNTSNQLIDNQILVQTNCSNNKNINKLTDICFTNNYVNTVDDYFQTNMLSNINNNTISCDPLEDMNDMKANNETQMDGLSNESQSQLKTNNTTKNDRIKECIQNTLSEKSKKRITALVNEIEQFNDIEKLFLYIQLPNGSAQDVDPLKQKGPGNPFGKKADIEVAQTYTWIQSHLEEDSTVSLPKQEVYEEYKGFCDANKFEPLCVADFGKAMKHVFPKVKPRRLGQRGNSKYCYSGLRKKINIESPELPILDTTGYDSNKSDRVVDLERNGESNFSRYSNSDQSIESESSANLIIDWASKLLNRSFESMSELAHFLINSNSIDLRSCETLGLKSMEEKHLKCNMKSSNSSKSKVHHQLQRKIHENKESKKRSEHNNKPIDNFKSVQNSLNNSKGLKKNRKNSASKCSDDLESKTCFNSQNAIAIKKEPELELSTNSFQTNSLIQQNRIQNKVAIPRTGTPSRISQPPISSIILVPTATVRLASPQSLNSESTTTTSVTTISSSPIKANTSKYKRIQPKPINIIRSDSESAVSISNLIESSASDMFSNTAKRRHSVSVPIRIENAVKLKQNDEIFNDKHLQSKRQIEEKDNSAFVTTKKRHIDSINTISNSLSNNTNSSGFDDANSSNSLSPISQELQTITSNVESINTSDIPIQELESEALMDYLSTNSIAVCNSSKDQWDGNNNKSAQLSQLRKLLENHLPNTMNSSKSSQQRVVDNVQLELSPYSELREALLRKNLNNSVQNYGPIKGGNNQNDQSLALKDQYSKSTQIDSFVKNAVLDNIQSIPITTKSGTFSSADYFVTTNQMFSEPNNVLFNSVQVQVPSVPPSPNARRRAFNFQPISPRNTPTIPENCSIDTIGYNGCNFSTTINSPPQYRINQQTVGVGPSQPSSEANSPFVSPRSTPIPLSRSRHNSGQSNYSALRQTPLQNFDSGVSSISSSPFISPQSTPVPISRVRAGTGGMQRTLNRARHSSGPGGPLAMSVGTASLLCHRSNSLSPMIGDTFSNATNSLTQLSFNEINSIGLQPNNNKSGKPISPSSPTAVIQSEMNSLVSDSIHGSSEYVYNGNECEVLRNDWTSNKLRSGLNSLVSRQRHASNPYTTPSTNYEINQYSHEIISLMKKSNELSECVSSSSNKSLLNRCQSVPVHQMINSNISIGSKNGHQICENIGNQLLDESTSISKSYPATPVCNQNFQFPPSPPSSTKLQTVMGSDDIISGNVLQSGQDLMVSGLQLRANSVWNANIATNCHQTDNELMAINGMVSNSNARRNLNELLTEPQDDLQTTLEDLRDCDNDFSKFAQELECISTNSYDD